MDITWTKRQVWGALGFTHRTEVIIGESEYRFVIDQPSKGYWTARGWRDGQFFLYREDRTLRAVKDEVIREVGQLRIAAKEVTK